MKINDIKKGKKKEKIKKEIYFFINERNLILIHGR